MKRILFIALAGLFVLLFVVASITKKGPSLPGISPTPTPVVPPAVQFQSINYHEVFHDPALEKTIGEKLQTPVSTATIGDYLVGYFASDSATFSTEVYQQNQVAKFVVQTMATDNHYYSSYLLTHNATAAKTLYDPTQEGSGFVWKVFPEEGIAFFTNEQSGFSGKIVYFAPTTYQSFLTTAGKTLGIADTPPNEAHQERAE